MMLLHDFFQSFEELGVRTACQQRSTKQKLGEIQENNSFIMQEWVITYKKKTCTKRKYEKNGVKLVHPKKKRSKQY